MFKKMTPEQREQHDRHAHHAKVAKAKRQANAAIPYVERPTSRQMSRRLTRQTAKKNRVTPAEVGRRMMQLVKQGKRSLNQNGGDQGNVGRKVHMKATDGKGNYYG